MVQSKLSDKQNHFQRVFSVAAIDRDHAKIWGALCNHCAQVNLSNNHVMRRSHPCSATHQWATRSRWLVRSAEHYNNRLSARLH
ncbi:hypothetical protein KC321_g66 [Hortaea werneckii]|nr:hypothetical protein KC321_g66 [Hortaea werneckii]